jgi:hypothetical protein
MNSNLPGDEENILCDIANIIGSRLAGIRPAHTPPCSDLPARSETKGPVRPHSQNARSLVGQRSPGIDSFTSFLEFSDPGKKAV